jgi:hypothetical protein
MWDDPKYQDIVIEPSGNSENKSPAFEQGWEKITMEFVNKYPLQ